MLLLTSDTNLLKKLSQILPFFYLFSSSLNARILKVITAAPCTSMSLNSTIQQEEDTTFHPEYSISIYI